MRICITRKGSRNLLHCTRVDGSVASADLGPNLPHHDLAHFVVERAFGLQDGESMTLEFTVPGLPEARC